jgi:hypothetical protein
MNAKVNGSIVRLQIHFFPNLPIIYSRIVNQRKLAVKKKLTLTFGILLLLNDLLFYCFYIISK